MAVKAKDLCAILEACHNSGVSSLKFGDVAVTFGAIKHTPDVAVVHDEKAHIVPDKELGETEVALTLTEEQSRMLEEMEIVDMHITDPVSFENYNVDLLLNGGRSIDA